MSTIYGGSGNDLIQPGTPPAFVDGTDLLYGNGGNDTIYSGGSSDTVYGGLGSDVIAGGSGTDFLYGDEGNDSLFGGTGADRLYGGDGDDTFFETDFAGGGTDVFVGGAGIDTIDFTGAGSAISLTLTNGNGTVDPSGGNNTDTLIGFENVVGTGFADVITGDVNINVLYGGAGLDQLSGGGGNDALYGGADADTLSGDAGNDLLFGGDGGDSLAGGAGDDTLRGGLGPDSFNGAEGLDVVDYSDSGVAVSVSLLGGTLVGAFGTAAGDTGFGVDGIIGSNFNDTLVGFNDSSTDPTDTYTNLFYGGLGDDSMSGLGSRDTLYGGAGNDTIDGGADNDAIWGDDGTDRIIAGTGDDLVYGGAGGDTIYGNDGGDVLLGDAGSDVMFGGAGIDVVLGGTGQDILFGGAGQDFVSGGDDADIIQMSFTATQNDVSGNETVDGGEGGDDNDTLVVDITGFSWNRIDLVFDPIDGDNGTITFFAADGITVVGTLTFENVELLTIVCFTAGTRIMTDRGGIAVEDLTPGDMVVTRDNGLQPLRWVGHRVMSATELQARPELQPVRIGAGALDAAGPERSLMVSPQHRVLIEGARAEMYFGESEVLVPAKHLLGLADVSRALPAAGVTYVHILFDQHEIVLSEGLWTESFQPADRTLSALDEAARDEVLSLFPELSATSVAFPSARLSLKAHEAKVLIAG